MDLEAKSETETESIDMKDSKGDIVENDMVEVPNAPKCCSIDRPVPILGFLKRYKKEYFKYDFITGLTLAIVAIPQSMSNSLMANIPPTYGLYGSVVSPIMFSIFTTTTQIHIGPYAVISTMIASFLSFLDYENQETEYVTAVLTIAFISGVFLTLLGIFRCGFVTHVLSDVVMLSFTTASTIIITTAQMGHYWGIRAAPGSCFKKFMNLIRPETIARYNWYAFLIGIIASVVLYVSKQLNKKYCPKAPIPIELFIVIISIIVVWAYGLKDRWQLPLIGDATVQKGFPPFSLPFSTYFLRLIPPSLIIGIISYSSTIAVSKTNARSTGIAVDDNQELIALGLAHLGGSFYSSLPCAVSLNRSSIAASLGAKTPVFQLISPLVVILCLYFLMDWLVYIPNSVLATVVIVNLFGTYKKFSKIPSIWRTSRVDFWSYMTCLVLIVFWSAEMGLLGGVLVNLVLLYIALKTKKEIKCEELKMEGKTVISAGDSLHFLNRHKLLDKVEFEISHNKPKELVIDLRKVSFIDISGLNTLHDIGSLLQQKDITYKFVACNDYINEKLTSYKITDVKCETV